jgi:hypothetical protein
LIPAIPEPASESGVNRPLVERKIHPPRTRLKTFDKSAGFTATRRQIERHARYVGAADTDDLPRWLVAWVWFNPQSRDPIGAVIECAKSIGRELFTPAEAQAVLEEAAVTPRQMKADNLAKWLGVTYADRQQLGLTRIGAVNVGKRARRVLRKRRDRLAKERKRRDRGVKPRAEYEANSLSKSKPWWQLGLSRATWYRLGRPALGGDETSPSTAVFLRAEEAPVSMEGKEGVFRGRAMPFAASGPRADTVARCRIITTSAFPAHKSEGKKFRGGLQNHFGQHERAAAFICEVIDLQQERALRQARDGTQRGLLKDWEARRRVLKLLDGGQTKTVKELMAEAAFRSRGAADLLLLKLVNGRLVERAGRGIYQIRRVA